MWPFDILKRRRARILRRRIAELDERLNLLRRLREKVGHRKNSKLFAIYLELSGERVHVANELRRITGGEER